VAKVAAAEAYLDVFTRHEAEPVDGGRWSTAFAQRMAIRREPRRSAMKRPKRGGPRIEDRGKTIEARQPWLKLEMSRRTWYRRQAEKSKENPSAC
jgi:hypothetical protein